MKITSFEIYADIPGIDVKAAVVADLHSHDGTEVLRAIESISPDIILSPGDMLERLDGGDDERNAKGLKFLNFASKLAPYYYSFGNHELCGAHSETKQIPKNGQRISRENMDKIKGSGVHLLWDSYEEYISFDISDFNVGQNKIYIGGLVSGRCREDNMPDLNFAKKFSLLKGYKILLCHHPEYYPKYLKDLDIDLIISGHAHGGQWRIFGRGVYAPDQGLFPKYTSGLYDNRLLVSRGTCNNAGLIPRLFNPCEVLSVHICSAK